MPYSPQQLLKQYWGFENFRESQREVIDSLLSGNDVLALLPTGGGKSICFQVPGLLKEGICIVVSPLIALIQNQVGELKKKDVKAIGLTGGIKPDELDILLDNCIHGGYKFLYLSPERLQQPLVQERIRQMPVNIIAIDEAHCISEWGHDFRPAYRQCSILKEMHPTVPIVGLTATATTKVVDDILTNLKISQGRVYRNSFARSNIAFSLKHKEDKRYVLLQSLAKNAGSSIVYVRSRKESVALSKVLNDQGEASAYFYGGLTSSEKGTKLNSWLNDTTRIMVATNAFGMGVDKPNVRTVIHYQLPESIENYYQEAGRAGRDGKLSHATLLINANDVNRAKNRFLDSLPSLSFVKTVYKKLNTFLQIAYGEGQEQTFALHFNEFCTQYDLHPSKTYVTLKLLDQNGVLSLFESSEPRSTIMMTAPKEELFKWIAHHPKLKLPLQVLLRTYGGVFDFETKINLFLLAKKTGQNEEQVKNALEKLDTDGMAKFKFIRQDITLTFLKPREDDRTVNAIAQHIDALHRTKRSKFEQMLAYVQNTTDCRVSFLLDYFGEKSTEPCGKCDICTSSTENSGHLDIKGEILKSLGLRKQSSRQLCDLLNFNENLILKALKELLEDKEVVLNADNTYDVNG